MLLVYTSQQYLEPSNTIPQRYSKIHLPKSHFLYRTPVVSGQEWFTFPDPYNPQAPPISNDSYIELCSGFIFHRNANCLENEKRMQMVNISSCKEYFCSNPQFLKNESTIHEHLQMITYCLYCDREDFDEFKQCNQSMNRDHCEKCGDLVCIDSHRIVNEFGSAIDLSLCYWHNQFILQNDFFHTYWVYYDVTYSMIIKFVFTLVFWILLIFLVIIPNVYELITKFLKSPMGCSDVQDFFNLRMIGIWLLSIAPLPNFLNGCYLMVFLSIVTNRKTTGEWI